MNKLTLRVKSLYAESVRSVPPSVTAKAREAFAVVRRYLAGLLSSPRIDGRNHFLDYLRAIAIVPVLLVHYRSLLLPGGALGVNVFFVLSGYFIFRQLCSDSTATQFLVRRMFRILPMYFLVLGILAILVEGENASFLKAWFMLQTPSAPGYRLGFFWTLQVEFWFYIIAPVLLLTMKSTRSRLLVLIGWFAVSLAISFHPVVGGVRAFLPQAFSNLLLYLSSFVVGGICSVLHANGRRGAFSGSSFLVLIALALTICCFFVDFEKGAEKRFWGLMISLTTAVCVFCVNAPVVRYIRVPGLAYVGLVSYSLYLIHLPILDFFTAGHRFGIVVDEIWSGKALRRHMTFSCVSRFLLICTVVASISYWLIELPSQRLGRRIAREFGGSSVPRRV